MVEGRGLPYERVRVEYLPFTITMSAETAAEAEAAEAAETAAAASSSPSGAALVHAHAVNLPTSPNSVGERQPSS